MTVKINQLINIEWSEKLGNGISYPEVAVVNRRHPPNITVDNMANRTTMQTEINRLPKSNAIWEGEIHSTSNRNCNINGR